MIKKYKIRSLRMYDNNQKGGVLNDDIAKKINEYNYLSQMYNNNDHQKIKSCHIHTSNEIINKLIDNQLAELKLIQDNITNTDIQHDIQDDYKNIIDLIPNVYMNVEYINNAYIPKENIHKLCNVTTLDSLQEYINITHIALNDNFNQQNKEYILPNSLTHLIFHPSALKESIDISIKNKYPNLKIFIGTQEIN